MRLFIAFGITAALAAVAACEVEYPTADAGGDASTGTDAGAIGCGASGFPAIDRSCSVADDCSVVEHQINCCGTLRALGIRASAKAAFDSAEATCRSSYPLCDCASHSTLADDGTSADGSGPARAECVAGQCRSTFAPADPGLCTPGGAPCAAGFSCCYPCGVEGCDFRCEPTCSEQTPGCINGCFLRP
jgi:hypothetical protein